MKHRLLTLAAIFGLMIHGAAFAQQRSITVASTTSTEQSGLFGFLLPRFTAKTGIQVKVVAVGMWYSSTTNQRKKNSWPRASASGAST
jgi:tungstate transport system substrate-binding protein